MFSLLDLLLILVSLAVCCYGVYDHVRLWLAGQPERRGVSLGKGIWFALRYGLFQRYFLKESYPGIMHLLMLVGFCIPLAVIMVTQWPFTLPLTFGNVFSFLLDIIGLAALIGCCLAIVRRYVIKPARLDNTRDDALALILVTSIFFLGFVIEGFRIVITATSQRPLESGRPFYRAGALSLGFDGRHGIGLPASPYLADSFFPGAGIYCLSSFFQALSYCKRDPEYHPSLHRTQGGACAHH